MKNTIVKGLVNMLFTDEITGETRSIDVENRPYNLLSRIGIFNGRPVNISLMAYTVRPGVMLASKQYPRLGPSSTISYTYNVSSLEGPWWVELKQRFQSTGSDRVFHGVTITDTTTSSDKSDSYANVALNTPEVQGATEALDITYRFVFEDDGMSQRYKNEFKQRLYHGFVSSHPPYRRYYTAVNGVIRTPYLDEWGQLGSSKFIYLGKISASGIGSEYANWSIDKLDYTQYNLRELFTLPDVINSSYNDKTDGGSENYVPAISEGIPIISSEVPYVGYPIGPMYSHAPGSVTWMEDLDGLALGKGYPLARKTDDAYMSEIAKCDNHVITITKSGNVGTARYYHTCIRVDGRVDSKFGRGWSLPILSRSIPLYDTGLQPHAKQVDPSGPQPQFSSMGKTGVYNTRTVYSVDYTDRLGLAIHNLVSHEYHYFDEFTTPALPSGMGNISIHQIARDDAGSLYIAAGLAGIVKITTPLTVPLISIIPKITLGVTGDVVAIGHGGDDAIFIHTSEGISYSTTQGSTWVNKGPWSFVGDSSKPSVIITHPTMSITANPNDFDEVAITFINGAESYGTWYSPITNTVTAPTSYDSFNLSNSNGLALECDPINGIWMFNSDGYSKRQTGYTKYGATVINSVVGTDNAASLADIDTVWLYDHQDLPYLLRRIDSTAGDSKCTVLLPSGRTQGNFYLPQRYLVCMNRGIRYDVMDGISRDAGGVNTVLTRSGDTIGRGAELNSIVISYTLSSTYQSADIMFESPAFPLDEPGLCRELGTQFTTHRWDQANALWKDARSWSLPSVATADGSSQIGAERHHFSISSQRFNGRAYLDITTATGTGSYGNGMTILATCTVEDKIPNTKSTAPVRRYPTGEGLAHTFVSLHNGSTGTGIAIQERNSDGQLTVLDFTVVGTLAITTLGASGSAGTTRLAVLINGAGTSVSVFRDGVQVGSNVNLGGVLTLGSSMDVILGTRAYDYRIDKSYRYDYFKGTMTNVQVWSRMLPPVELVADNNDREGLVAGSGLVVRYLMTGELVEDRLTSLTENTAPYGYIHSFQEGDLSADSYIRGEAYNAMVSKDSIVKGNAMNVSGNISFNYGADVITTVTSPATGTNIVSHANTEIRELASWSEDNDTKTNVGEVGSTSISTTAYSEQTSIGDLSLEFEIGMPYHGRQSYVRLNYVSGVTTTTFCTFSYANSIDISVIYSNGSTTEVIPFSYTTGQRHKMEYIRSTGEISIYKDEGSGWVLITTPVVHLLDANIRVGVDFYSNYSGWDGWDSNYNAGIFDTYITYTPDYNVMRIGDRDTATGFYTRGRPPLPVQSNPTVKLYVDGEYRPIIRSTTKDGYGATLGDMTPVEGSVVMTTSGTNLLFHDSDLGKAVTIDPIGLRKA